MDIFKYLTKAELQSYLTRLQFQLNIDYEYLTLLKAYRKNIWAECDPDNEYTQGAFERLNQYNTDIKNLKKEVAIGAKLSRLLKDAIRK